VYLNEKDEFKRDLMFRIATRHVELLLDLNDDLAGKVIEKLAKSMR